MEINKFLNRIQYLVELIRKESTGSPKQLAARLNISERMVYRYIREIEAQHGELEFCRIKNSYKFKPLT